MSTATEGRPETTARADAPYRMPARNRAVVIALVLVAGLAGAAAASLVAWSFAERRSKSDAVLAEWRELDAAVEARRADYDALLGRLAIKYSTSASTISLEAGAAVDRFHTRGVDLSAAELLSEADTHLPNGYRISTYTDGSPFVPISGVFGMIGQTRTGEYTVQRLRAYLMDKAERL